MTILDGNLQFSGTAGIPGSSDSPTTGTQNSANVVDLLNARDMGVGDDPALKILVNVTTAFTNGTSFQVTVQGSVDNSTYVTLASGPVIAEANLLIGTHLLDIDLPRVIGAFADRLGAAEALPRYLRLQYVSIGNHNTGAVFGAIVLDRQDQIAFPSGVIVPN
jgi:hypothetical protein